MDLEDSNPMFENIDQSEWKKLFDKAKPYVLGVITAVVIILIVIFIVDFAKKRNASQTAADIQEELSAQAGNKYLGCFNDCSGGRALPDMVGVADLPACEQAARERGAKYFGLQYREGYGGSGTGECWVGNEGYDSQGVATNCSKEGEPGYVGYAVGGRCSNAVYQIL